MKTAIILFSRTGNTLAVAEKIRDTMLSQGQPTTIERIRAEDEDPNNRMPLRLTASPDPTDYDAVIFAGPVQAFSLSPIMKAYLKHIPTIRGKKVSLFVTQQFPKPWMGGKQAIGQMKRLCLAKGAEPEHTGIVNWSSKARKAQIEELVATLTASREEKTL